MEANLNTRQPSIDTSSWGRDRMCQAEMDIEETAVECLPQKTVCKTSLVTSKGGVCRKKENEFLSFAEPELPSFLPRQTKISGVGLTTHSGPHAFQPSFSK
jgi:hypothetical protein